MSSWTAISPLSSVTFCKAFVSKGWSLWQYAIQAMGTTRGKQQGNTGAQTPVDAHKPHPWWSHYFHYPIRFLLGAQKAWQTLLQHYQLFFQLVTLTGMQIMVMGMVVLMVGNVTALPMLMNMMKLYWDNALNVKDPLLIQKGRWYVLALLVITALKSVVSHCIELGVFTFGARFREKFHEKMKDKTCFKRMQAENNAQRRNPNSVRSGLARTLTIDPERFINLLLGLHRVGMKMLYWAVVALIELANLGLLTQAIAVLAGCMVVSLMVASFLSQSASIDTVSKKRDEYERVFTSITDNPRADKYPNMLAYGLSLLGRDNQSLWYKLRNADRADEIRLWSGRFSDYIASAVIILAVFGASYLTTDMSLGFLQRNVYNLLELVGAAMAVVDFCPAIEALRVSAVQLRQLYAEIWIKNGPMAVSSTGLRAQGEIKQFSNGALSFRANIAQVAPNNAHQHMRAYHASKQPDQALVLECADVVYVTGENGAGKSLLFTALAQEIPGLVLASDDGVDQACCEITTLYCEQDMFILPQSDDEKPWTPEQLMFLLWPERQVLGAEGLDKVNASTVLFYGSENDNRGQAKVSVRMSYLMEKVDDYLDKLKFTKEHLKNTQELREYGVDLTRISGGQKQKLRLAMYFAMIDVLKPRLFLVDEPYNHLDIEGRQAVREVIMQMKQAGQLAETTMLVVTHDDNSQAGIALYDKVMVICRQGQGSVSFYGASAEFWQAGCEPGRYVG